MPQAKDIRDEEILRVIEDLCIHFGMWMTTYEVQQRYLDFPAKVVNAKLKSLMARGLVTGCACGCRGDWELTTKGRELAGIHKPWRENPLEV